MYLTSPPLGRSVIRVNPVFSGDGPSHERMTPDQFEDLWSDFRGTLGELADKASYPC